MSSFTAEEVEFLRSRGNLWCEKVWTGNLDARSKAKYEAGKDDEAVKEFIVEKYEKKR